MKKAVMAAVADVKHHEKMVAWRTQRVNEVPELVNGYLHMLDARLASNPAEIKRQRRAYFMFLYQLACGGLNAWAEKKLLHQHIEQLKAAIVQNGGPVSGLDAPLRQWLKIFAATNPIDFNFYDERGMYFVRQVGLVDDDIRAGFFCLGIPRFLRRDYLDNPAVRQLYCQRQMPGYEMLALLDMELPAGRIKTLKPDLRVALERDSVARFEILRTLTRVRITQKMFFTALHVDAPRIAAHIFQRAMPDGRWMPYEKLLFVLSGNASVPERVAASIVMEIEKQRPGIVRNAMDPFGNNLLWHAYIQRIPHPPGCHDSSPLIKALLRCGADPNHRNPLQLSYSLLSAVKVIHIRSSIIPHYGEDDIWLF